MNGDRGIHRPTLEAVADDGNSPPAKDASDHGFVRPKWFGMLAEHCFADQRLVQCTAQAGRAKVTLPLIDQGDRACALANYYSFSYGPMFEAASTPDTRLTLVRKVAADLRKSHSRISLYPLVDDSGTADMLRRAFASAGWIALLTDQNSNHVLDINGRDFAAYWEARPGNLRSAVKRKMKHGRYSYEIYETVSERLWNDYLSVYRASWKNAEPYPDMIRAIAEDAAKRGVLRLGFARDGERAVATQLWTIEYKTACIHKIAHNSSDDMGSPGTLLSHHMFAHMIDSEQVTQIDYGTGGNAYKRDWMERERPMLRLDCFDPRKAAMWLPALKTRISQLVRRPT